MGLVALITWIITASGGLYLLAIWLIEYDRDFHRALATHLPVPVISAHALLAITGLVLWALYLVVDERRLAVAASLVLVAVASLGLIMGVRWIRVYRSNPAREPAGSGGEPRQVDVRPGVVPERSFPLPVVIGHGVFAAATLVLVLSTALRSGS
jgi:hypothetical protein